MDIKVKKFLVRIFDKSLKIGWKMKAMLTFSLLFAVIYTLANFFVMFFKDNTITYINTHINNTIFTFGKKIFYSSFLPTEAYIFCALSVE